MQPFYPLVLAPHPYACSDTVRRMSSTFIACTERLGFPGRGGLVCMEPTARAVALVGAETVSRAEIFYTGNGRSGGVVENFRSWTKRERKSRTIHASCASATA
jgi:hypothetical protein